MRIAAAPANAEWKDADGERFRWAAQPGEPMRVSCYTNAERVELTLNGRSLGEKACTSADGCRVCWEVPFEAGMLRAVVPGAEDVLCTPGAASNLSLTPDVESLPADGQSVWQLEVLLADAEGHPVSADERVTYQVAGDAQLLGVENGTPDDLTPYAAPYRNTRDGRAIVYVRAGTRPGEVVVHAHTTGGLSTNVVLHQA